MYPPPEAVLNMFVPGDINPLMPIDEPKFDIGFNSPYSLHAATGMIHSLSRRDNTANATLIS